MKQYAIYLRKSRADLDAEALGEMETLARHKRILTELAKRQDLNVVKTYEEIVSGESISERPQMTKLLEDIHNGMYDGVICMELERLARGNSRDQTEVFEAFKYTDTLIITPSKTYDPNNPTDEEYFEFGLFMSRREYKTINRRLQVGREQSVKEGNFIGSIAPYGYDKVRLPHGGGFTLAENEDAKYVRMIFDWYVNENMTVGNIRKRLDDMGSKPAKGDHWSIASVRDLLRNPVYIGKLRWNWRKNQKVFVDGKLTITRPRNDLHDSKDYMVVDGKHPAIIDEALFNAARAREGSCPRVKVGKQMINPFVGITKCSCGYALVYQKHRKGIRPRLVCTNQRYCHVKSIAFEDFTQLVTESLKDHIKQIRVKMSDNNFDEVERHKQLIETVKKQLKEVEDQQNGLYELLEKRIYTPEIFLQRQNVLTERSRKLNEQYNELLANAPTPIDYNDRIFQLQDAIRLINEDPIDVKKASKLLKSIIKRITYYNNGIKASIDVELDF